MSIMRWKNRSMLGRYGASAAAERGPKSHERLGLVNQP